MTRKLTGLFDARLSLSPHRGVDVELLSIRQTDFSTKVCKKSWAITEKLCCGICRSYLKVRAGLSKPVSRVLYSPKANGDHLSSPGVTPGVKRPTRGLGRTSHISPYSVLLRMGFAQPAGHPAAGELLPHHFTLIPMTLDSRRRNRNGMFLWHFP